jgi:methylenetetrahydrofolate dehydrogenase (NADP+)/methenyltetrahydrofolate cyclohydrolase
LNHVVASDHDKEMNMAAKIIDGEALAAEMNAQISAQAKALADGGKPVRLVAVQVGENPASKIYTNMQARSCQAVGIGYQLLNIPAETTQQELLATIRKLNEDQTVSAIILQMPLPPQIDARVVQVTISPDKDVEGMNPVNMGRLFFGGGLVSPCTPRAAVELLNRTRSDLAGLEAVVVGHSEIVGKPIAMMLLQSPNASPTVTVCHVATKDLAFHTRRADVLIVAAGVSQAKYLGWQRRRKAGETLPPPKLAPLISGDMIKSGSIVIDVAINRIPRGFDDAGNVLSNDKGKPDMMTVGDVDFEAALQVASAITPVPGGVGPVTTAMLLRNALACAGAFK